MSCPRCGAELWPAHGHRDESRPSAYSVDSVAYSGGIIDRPTDAQIAAETHMDACLVTRIEKVGREQLDDRGGL